MATDVRTSLYRLYREMVDSHLGRLHELKADQVKRFEELDSWPGGKEDADVTQQDIRRILRHRGEAVHTYREMIKEASSAVVFAAMTAEAFIYDYAVVRLSSKHVKEHLNSLRTKSSWLIIPRLVTGNQLDPGGTAMNLYGRLIEVRNDLVHYKASWVKDDNTDPYPDPVLKGLVETAESTPRTLDALAQELDAIDPQARARELLSAGGERRLERWVTT